jgi:Arc/MetJ-type ribon-helix-helix transcriptional regulator
MKLSVSLPDEDVEFLDRLASESGVGSRSAGLHLAIKLLRDSSLQSAYEEAFSDWLASEDASAWDTTVGDGVEG